MSYGSYLVRRAAFAVLAVYAVVTVAFVLINATLWQKLKNRVAAAEYFGASPEEIRELRRRFKDRRNLDTPILERYVEWLVDVTTFDWGYSFAYNQSVFEVLDGRVPTTLEYLVPGVLLAVGLGLLFGVYVSFARDGALDWGSRVAAYVLLGVPAFMLVLYYHVFSGVTLVRLAGTPVRAPSLHPQVLASVVVATGLFAGQLRFARTVALEQSGQAFVKMLRAKGARRIHLARHVLRNAAAPILSLSLSEMLAVLMLDMYVVERVLLIDGLARATLRAARQSDVALVIWATMIVVVIGIVGNFLQESLSGYLDPRVRAE